ncbi:hypothetical protein, partial [Ralstonia solanacearum]
MPKNVRLDVSSRKEKDDSKRGSLEAYFDLIDYRTIAQANWELFKNSLGIGHRLIHISTTPLKINGLRR